MCCFPASSSVPTCLGGGAEEKAAQFWDSGWGVAAQRLTAKLTEEGTVAFVLW